MWRPEFSYADTRTCPRNCDRPRRGGQTRNDTRTDRNKHTDKQTNGGTPIVPFRQNHTHEATERDGT